MLIVDDNPSIHNDFREILAPKSDERDQAFHDLEAQLFGEPMEAPDESSLLQVAIDSAFQGEDAIDMVASASTTESPYFMAFVDVRMPPGIDGIETIKRLWTHSPQLSVVICTAFTDYSWKQIVEILGPSPDLLILRKPFDSIEVRQMAMAMLSRLPQKLGVGRACAQGDSGPGIHRQMVDAMMASVRDGVALLDASGVVQRINQPGRALLGPDSQGASRWPGLSPAGLDAGVPPGPLAAIQQIVRSTARQAGRASQRQIVEVWSDGGDVSRLDLHVNQLGPSDPSTAGEPLFLCVFAPVESN